MPARLTSPRKRGWWAAALLLLFPAFLSAQSSRESVPEYQVKAAFLFNFAKFVEWPAESFPAPDTPLTIGLVGIDDFDGHLERITRDKTIDGRKLALRFLSRTDDFAGCHLLFFSRSEESEIPELLARARGRPILTVGETANFTRRGGVIEFYLENNRVRFEVNTLAAERSRLAISSKLLKVARLSRAEPAGEGK